ncbi:endonuclease/exonuclease/phosphatase family protein [Deinococcus cellulosilyticus]|uniref:Endonuclease n=1 Tax=Deinococcus cellulosilyticus (strain DSM 18568 / NBRC 106333 / KACC 11606 / 5516J-15) TaxID=1223518 RepID=A0A511N5I8_DEIC1|nr:endonuclease/exonuclease/phosphatase family protein [Deinococcus cellulosilyticus]GEM48094.1 endonuclease [Deinococcus cellulosilyticus NBRC 106333 = KACC 11606]
MRLIFGLFLNALPMLVLWYLHQTRAETHWLFTLLASVPQHVFIVPTVFVIFWSLFKRRWKLLFLQTSPVLVWLFLLMGLQLHQPVSVPPSSLRVMTWNVHGGLAGMEPILNTVKQVKPDLLCLQEARTTGPRLFSLLQQQEGGWEMAQLGELILLSRFPVVQKRRLEFPSSRHTELEATVQIQNAAVRIITVHFDRHRLGPTAWDQRMGRTLHERAHRVSSIRQEGVNVLLESYSKARQQNQHFLACGDFNMPPLGPLYRQLGSHLKDAFAHSGMGFGHTWNASFKVLRIDHIWTSPDITLFRTWVEESTGSDHLPVVTDFQL